MTASVRTRLAGPGTALRIVRTSDRAMLSSFSDRGEAHDRDQTLHEHQRCGERQGTGMAESIGEAEPLECVAQELPNTDPFQRRACVVAVELPRLGDATGGAHGVVLGRLFGYTDGDRARLDVDAHAPDHVAGAAVELVAYGPVELDPDLVRRCCLDERRLGRLPDCGARQGASPLHRSLRGDHTDIEPSVVGLGTFEHLDAAEDPADVADEHAARHSFEPALVVDLDDRSELFLTEVTRAGPHVGHPSEAILQRAVGVADHERIPPRARHHREPLPVEAAHVELADVPVERDAHRALDVAGNPQVRGQEVRGAGGDDPDPHLATGERVDATLHHPVATPHDDEIGAARKRLASALRRLLALRHLVPGRIVDALQPRARDATGPNPPPSDFPVCAITATEVMSSPPRDDGHG